MQDFQNITNPIAEELEPFERAFSEAMSSNTLPMDGVLRYVAGAKGKRLRPILVFLTAKLFGEVNNVTQRTALFVELLHTATLIHDDVVDDSDTRRGQASVNTRWNNLTAVLAGDYLLSKAMSQLADPADSPILKEMLSTAMAMSEGELIQCRSQNTEDRRQNNSDSCLLSSDFYLDVIMRKTAMLMRSCCVGGALSVDLELGVKNADYINKVGDFGLNLGLVFQMRDDILDDDNPKITALAEKLLPLYMDKALKALDALEPMAKNASAWASLKALTVFCGERSS